MKPSLPLAISSDDLQEIAATRIQLDRRVPLSIQEAAETFNEQLQHFLDELNQYFGSPTIAMDEVSFEDLEKIGQLRRAMKFELLKSLLTLLSARIALHGEIQNGVAKNVADARAAFDSTLKEVHAKLKPYFADKARLDHAIYNSDLVQEAEKAINIAKGSLSVMSTAPNKTPEQVETMRKKWQLALQQWCSDVACIESLPEAAAIKQAVWKSST